jgi:hypothetical protein
MSLAKTLRRLNVIHVTCDTTSLYVTDFKCALDFGEGDSSTDADINCLGLSLHSSDEIFKARAYFLETVHCLKGLSASYARSSEMTMDTCGG